MIEPGSRIGRFRLERSLGQGAMGNVFLAVDPEIEREIAIKIVRTDLADADHRDEVQTRFLREAKIAGRLQHPNIVTIYDVGREDGRTFIAMEYVDGRPLSRLLRPDTPLTDAQRFLIARQTAEALCHAHERQVIHRDVKPGNILIRKDGVVKVSDFGIGKLLNGDGDLTRTGMMVGSPSYMSPEQIRGDTLDGRSDIFSLGVVLYEMFTGARPFPGETVTALVYQILHTEPRDPTAVRPDLPPFTADILRKALAKKRDDRYADARALLRDLRRASNTPAARDSSPTSITHAYPGADATPILAGGKAASGGTTSTAPGVPTASSGSAPTVIVERRGGAALLFGIASLVLAAAAFLFVLTQPRRAASIIGVSPRSASTSAVPSSPAPVPISEASSPPAAPAVLTAPSSSSALSTASVSISEGAASASPSNPAAAESPSVGRVKENAKKSGDASTVRPSSRTAATTPPLPATSTASPALADEAVYDNLYRVRRAMKFQINPDQARLSVDGKAVGIADDWDDHGGGKTFPLAPGIHHVQATLPGYRDLNLQIVVSPSAGSDVESAGDEMKKTSREPFSKVGKIDYSTQGDVFFDTSLASAHVLVDGHEQGIGSTFTAAQPLKLVGPMVHDVVLTDAGKSKSLRVLAASTAGKNRILIKETLK